MPTTILSDNFDGANGTVLADDAFCNFDGSFATLTEHTHSASATTWGMDAGNFLVENNQGWTGRASDFGSSSHFRLRSKTVQANALSTEFDYKVASWASGTFGSNSSSNGTAIWARYLTQWGPLYEAYIDKFDNKIGVKRKVPAIGYTGSVQVSNNGCYYTLKSDAECPVIGAGTFQATYTAVGSTNLVRDATDGTGASGTSYHFRVTFRTLSANMVQVKIWRDGVLVWSCTDNDNDCTDETTSTTFATDLANSRYATGDSRWQSSFAHPPQTAGYFGARSDNAQAFFDNFVATEETATLGVVRLPLFPRPVIRSF